MSEVDQAGFPGCVCGPSGKVYRGTVRIVKKEDEVVFGFEDTDVYKIELEETMYGYGTAICPVAASELLV